MDKADFDLSSLERARDPNWFRTVLGQYPTGVSVVTAIADGNPTGLAIGSFTSVSLDPPLVAFLPSALSSSWGRIRTARSFCVNILAADQETLCRTFASKSVDRFARLEWRSAGSGAPILSGVVAWIDCDLEAIHEGGDHHIVIGRVRDLDIERATLPLLFYQGGYGRFSPLSVAIRDERFGRQLQLVDRARPSMEALAERLSAQVVACHCDSAELTVLASAGIGERRHLSAATIGHRIPVVPPVGIWWMAFAEPQLVEAWLRHVESADVRAQYRQALVAIREAGYSRGRDSVYEELETLLDQRQGPGGEPTHEERRKIVARLALEPLASAPLGGDQESPQTDVISLWAPVFAAGDEIALGLMLSAHRRGGRTLGDYAEALLELARDVGDLAG